MKNLIYVVVLSSIFFACDKKVDSKKIEEVANTVVDSRNVAGLLSIANYYDVISKRTNAVFGLSMSSNIYDTNNENAPLLFGGTFIADNGKFIKGGKVNVNELEFMPDENFNYGSNFIINKNIMGSPTSIDFEKPASFAGVSTTPGVGSKITNRMYVPSALVITGPALNSTDLTNQPTIKVGETFSWIPDRQNDSKMGIIFGIEYSPNEFGNEPFKSSNPTTKRNGFVIPDNGTYTLPSTLFNGIPLGSVVSVSIIRANYKIEPDIDNNTSTIFAYHQKNGTFKYVNN